MTQKIEKMPTDVKDMLMGLGMDEEQAEETGALGQKVRDFVLDNIGVNELVTPADLAVAAAACQMTGAWFSAAAEQSAEELAG